MAWVVGETSVGPPSGVDPVGTMRLRISNNNNNNKCASQVTRCSLGKYWSRDFFQKEAERSRQGVGNPEPYLFSLPLSRSDRLPRRWGQQAARLGYTGYL